jgi:hypothetical protein
MLVWSKQVVGIPAVIVQDCIGQIIDHLQDGTPIVWARLPAEAQLEHHEEDSNLNKLHAGLHCRCHVEMTLLEGRL